VTWCHLNPPIVQNQGVTELLDALEMSGVSRDQLQAKRQGGGGDHRIGDADRLAGPFQLDGDVAGQLASGTLEGEDFFRGHGFQEVLQLPRGLFLLIASDHLHVGDGRDRVTAESLAVGGRMGGDSRIHCLGDVRKDVGVDEGFVQRSTSRQGSCRWR
jgi:hypothetical protein